MKYIIRILLALIFCRCVVLFPVQAQVIDPAAEVEQYLAGEDMTAVKDAIPPEVAEQMEQQGISSFSKLISMPVEQVWKILTDAFKEHLGAPLRVLLSLVGAVLLCSLVKGIGSSLGSGVHQVFSIIMTVFVISLLIRPVIECILSLHTVFADFSLFLTVYIRNHDHSRPTHDRCALQCAAVWCVPGDQLSAAGGICACYQLLSFFGYCY